MRGERKQLAKCGHYTPSADNLGATKEVAARMRCLSKKQEFDEELSKHMCRYETCKQRIAAELGDKSSVVTHPFPASARKHAHSSC